ncbi:MAG: thiamine pyrophosphate-dependent enzyme [Eubacteriales bacterium]|nr:thiamine pyrophosphate-dependent enzyme [Eubacteriales bacterium]
MSIIYKKPESLNDTPFTFCPGCTHGLIIKLVTTVIDELKIGGDTISVGCVGCGGYIPWFMNIDTIYSLHGRAPANATGIKRMNPGKVVFTYQGDGDLASIGTAEIVHAAHRGEKITTIFVNNTTYGMTGGQMAPTTLPGQKTTTSPYGRDPKHCGNPIRMSEMLATIDGAKFIERVSVDSPVNVRKAKKAIRRAFECQMEGKGFALVEVLSSCPTNWGKTPVEALERIRTEMIPYYPLGNFKNF